LGSVVLSAGGASAGVLSGSGVASAAGDVLSGVPESPVVVAGGSASAGDSSAAGAVSVGVGAVSVGVGVVWDVGVVSDAVVSAGGGASCANAGRVDQSATAAVAAKATPKRRTRTNRFPLAANGVSSR
jgi:hypothetical protein